MSPELAAILGVGAFLLTLQVASTLWLANIVRCECHTLRADIRRACDGLHADVRSESSPSARRPPPPIPTFAPTLAPSARPRPASDTTRVDSHDRPSPPPPDDCRC